jgi:integrase
VVKTPAVTARVRSKFSRDHVYVTTQNTPLTHPTSLYHAFIRCCRRAGIEVKTFDAEGLPAEHVDLHSLRRSFATNLIVSGADPTFVRELFGRRRLDMTMKIYAKLGRQSKRNAVGRLSYGDGAVAPKGVLQYPDRAGGGSNPVQNGHQRVTVSQEAAFG